MSRVIAQPIRQDECKRILVIGDWFVDENWVVARERSASASGRGKMHYHVLQKRASSVEALGGAGVCASLLRALPKSWMVRGLGAWRQGDDPDLQRILMSQIAGTADTLTPLNPYREARCYREPRCKSRHALAKADRVKPERDKRLKLINFSQLCKSAASCSRKFECSVELATNRNIRVYLQDSEDIELLQRIDWEQPPSGRDSAGLRDWSRDLGENNTSWEGVFDAFGEPDDPIAIVVSDRMKGVVSSALIGSLVRYCNEHKLKPCWYIYSKDWHLDVDKNAKERWVLHPNSWLLKLMENDGGATPQDVRLLFVPFAAAQIAVREDRQHVHNWCLQSHRPTWRAMKLMDALALGLARETGHACVEPLVVVLPEHQHLFARTPLPGKPELVVVWNKKENSSFSVGMPIGSMLFASIVARLLENENRAPGQREEALALYRATALTEKWVEAGAKRIFRADKPDAGQSPDWKKLWLSRASPGAHVTCDPWKDVYGDWEDARKKYGYIPGTARACNTSDKRMELWRAMTDVDGYICLERRRETIRKIKRQIAIFKESLKVSPGRHVSMLITAGPGSGKSALLDKLARESEMELLTFNITQMVAPSQILDCFDTIVSRQSSSDNAPPILVFFDEINATLGSEEVYGKFLDPIDRGTYVRAGKTFSMRPCVWVFAGTQGGDAGAQEDNRKKNVRAGAKRSDFLSRLTIPPLDFSTDPADPNALLERRYVGASLILRVFPEVRCASEWVLDAFDLLHDTTPRACEKFVRNFRDVRQGEVRHGNVPVDRIKEAWRAAEKERKGVTGKSCKAAKELATMIENHRGSPWRNLLELWRELRKLDPTGPVLPPWHKTLFTWSNLPRSRQNEELVEIVPEAKPLTPWAM